MRETCTLLNARARGLLDWAGNLWKGCTPRPDSTFMLALGPNGRMHELVMFDVKDKPNLVERALLISACFRRDDMVEAKDLLVELEELVRTLGIAIGEVVPVF